MYQMSQSYVPQSSGRLEYIAQNASRGKIHYSAASDVGYGSFIPFFSNTSQTIQTSSTPPHFQYNLHSKTYSLHQQNYISFTPQAEYHFIPDHFLKPGKGGKFVGHAREVQEFVEETFQHMFNQSFPDDIKISVVDEKQFRQLAPSPSTIGLSLNRSEQGLLSEVFVLNDTLGRVLLTLGHELGHVLTPTLENKHTEEAKAFAFSLAWMETIKEHDIAGLGEAVIMENPAQNGLHDVAFQFVQKLVRQGKDVWEVYQEIVSGVSSLFTTCDSTN